VAVVTCACRLAHRPVTTTRPPTRPHPQRRHPSQEASAGAMVVGTVGRFGRRVGKVPRRQRPYIPSCFVYEPMGRRDERKDAWRRGLNTGNPARASITTDGIELQSALIAQLGRAPFRESTRSAHDREGHTSQTEIVMKIFSRSSVTASGRAYLERPRSHARSKLIHAWPDASSRRGATSGNQQAVRRRDRRAHG